MGDFHGRTMRSAIVLAAGDGKRLQDFVHRLRGDRLPKQYVDFGTGRSMLEQTFARAERLAAPERIFTVAGRHHLAHPEARRQLAARRPSTVILQPENKETAPGVLLGLAHAYALDPDAAVVVFPSDHFVGEELLFAAHADVACRVVERHPEYLVLLGIDPHTPETEYGYIVPGKSIDGLAPLAVRRVAAFREKPDRAAARDMIGAGALWNTMVMIFRAATVVELIERLAPPLYRFFERVYKAIGSADAPAALSRVYDALEPVNFSTGVLERIAREEPARLLVLPVRGVDWSDWGSEQRIANSVELRLNPRERLAATPEATSAPGSYRDNSDRRRGAFLNCGRR